MITQLLSTQAAASFCASGSVFSSCGCLFSSRRAAAASSPNSSIRSMLKRFRLAYWMSLVRCITSPKSRPITAITDRPIAESTEYRPPTQSQNPNMLSVLMPNSSTSFLLVETATKCFDTASSPRASVSQRRAAVALVSVSNVVNVLDATMKSVVAADDREQGPGGRRLRILGEGLQRGAPAMRRAVVAVLLAAACKREARPPSLGEAISVEQPGGSASQLFSQGSEIPTGATESFTTAKENEKRLYVHVLRGAGRTAATLHSDSWWEVDGVSPAPVGEPRVMVTFEVDAQGQLSLTGPRGGSAAGGEEAGRVSGEGRTLSVDRTGRRRGRRGRPAGVAVGCRTRSRSPFPSSSSSSASSCGRRRGAG